MRFVIFSKTRWDEAPRLRHQVTRLLLAQGHDVVFVERPEPLGRPTRQVLDGLILLRFGELLHHQLRMTRGLARANAAFETRQWDALRDVGHDTVVVNFNYDYWFLRRMFQEQPIITILNDDFLARARWFSRRQVRWSLTRVVHEADAVLAVSTPLCGTVKMLGGRADLFLPWARLPYRRPTAASRPRDMLYWGYINRRLDWPLIHAILAAGIRIHFVGPVEGGRGVRRALDRAGAVYHGASGLGQIEPILAQCGSSILPYNLSRSDLAVTMSNRGFDLLSRGLSLLYVAYPELLRAPPAVIRICRSPKEFIQQHRAACETFWSAQGEIQAFLEEHTAEQRYDQFMRVVEAARGHRRAQHLLKL